MIMIGDQRTAQAHGPYQRTNHPQCVFFFSTSRRMPTANAEALCRSERTQRRVSPRPLRRHPPIRSSPRRSPPACAEKLLRIDPHLWRRRRCAVRGGLQWQRAHRETQSRAAVAAAKSNRPNRPSIQPPGIPAVLLPRSARTSHSARP